MHARLRATVPPLLPFTSSAAPAVLGRPGRRILAQRGEDVLVVCALDDAFQIVPETQVSFPALWTWRRSGWAVTPDAGMAVFAGPHAIQAVERSCTVQWELKHGCWEDSCQQTHQSYAVRRSRRPRLPKARLRRLLR